MDSSYCEGEIDGDVEMESQPEEENEQSGAWYEKPVYKRYWRNYNKVKDWFKRHRRVMHQLEQAEEFQNWQRVQHQQFPGFEFWDPYYSYYLSWYYYCMATWQYQNMYSFPLNVPCASAYAPQEFEVPSGAAPISKTMKQRHDRTKRRKPSESSSSRSSSRSARRKRKKAKERRKDEKPTELIIDGVYEDSDLDINEQFEMHITDDMLEFFAASAKHRHLRDTKKELDKKTGEEKRVPNEEAYVELGEVEAGKSRATVLPPSERPGVKRTMEMKLLYGDGAAMIHGMETAMQLNFDRTCDIKQPKLWPHLPLNIKFD